MKRVLVCLALSMAPMSMLGQAVGAIQGYANLGGVKATTQGASSTNNLQGVIPHALICAYLTGTTTPATIYADANHTPLSSCFFANASGVNAGGWIFFSALNQGVDVFGSGGIAPNTYPSPVPLCIDCFPSSEFTVTTGVQSAEGTAPIQVNGASATPETGAIDISCPTCGILQQLVQPPTGGQYVIVYPTAFVDGATGQGTSVGGATGGNLGSAELISPGSEAGTSSITWSVPALPSYVLPANITAIYAFQASSSTAGSAPSGTLDSCGGLGIPWAVNNNFLTQFSATGTGASSQNLTNGSGEAYMLGAITMQMTGLTGANFHTAQIEATFATSGNCLSSVSTNVPSVGWFVYYTGSAPPANANLQVVAPLNYNQTLNQLSIDPLAEFPGNALAPTVVAQLPAAAYFSNWIVPITDGTSSTDCATGGSTTYVLCKSNGSNWVAYSTGGAPTGSAGGDLSGSYPDPGVAKIEGGAPPASALFGGWNISHQPVTSTTENLATFLAGLTGCATPAYAYVPDDSQCEQFASLISPSFTTPSLGAASATSLLASGIVDGEAPVTITTGAGCTLGTASGCNATAYNSGYTYNQEGTAATAITYTLPTAAAGKQYCVSNSFNGSAATTGTLAFQTSTAGQYIIYTDGTLTASDGYVISAGAGGDAACVVGVDGTHWQLYVNRGTWTAH